MIFPLLHCFPTVMSECPKGRFVALRSISIIHSIGRTLIWPKFKLDQDYMSVLILQIYLKLQARFLPQVPSWFGSSFALNFKKVQQRILSVSVSACPHYDKSDPYDGFKTIHFVFDFIADI